MDQEGTFGQVIDFQGLRRMVAVGHGPIVVDNSGRPLTTDGLPDDAPIPSLIVGQVTEAVKQVGDGMVTRYLNRDVLWAVKGFVLGHDVIGGLPDDIDSPERLIDAVREAGHEWHALFPSPGEPPVT